MKRFLLVLLFIAPLLRAEPLSFGEPFPLANTRYGTAPSRNPEVQWNGRDFFVFWHTENNLRVTKLVEGEHRGGRNVLAGASRDTHVSVTWTGTHFLVVATGRGGLVGQLLDANADPVGETFPITDHSAEVQAVASNGRTVLVFYRQSQRLSVVALTTRGIPAGIGATVDVPGAGLPALASNGDGFAAMVPTDSGIEAILFDGDGRERSRAAVVSGTFTRAPQVAIASDGRAYLAAWQAVNRTEVQAAHLAADGSAGAAMTLNLPAPMHHLDAGALDVAWTGANWAVAFSKGNGFLGQWPLRVAYVHATVPQVVGHEDAGSGLNPSMAAGNGRVMMAWWPGDEAPTVAGSFLPLAGREPRPVLFAAADQDLAATASTADATLVVWNDRVNGESTLRAGVRSPEGDWVEREIAPQSWDGTVAATDGRDFVVTGHRNDSAAAIFLDASSRVTAGPVPLPISPQFITWTGTDYLIAGNRSIVRLSRGGTVSAVVTGGDLDFLALASNGREVMALMMLVEFCPTGFCFGRPSFTQLGPDLLPIGEPRLIAPTDNNQTVSAQLVWDGKRFLAAWESEGDVKVAEVPPGGSEATIVAVFESTVPGSAHMTAAEGGVALTWRESTLSNTQLRRMRVATVRHDDSTSDTAIDEVPLSIRNGPLVAALPNGRLALLTSMPQYAPPHHGSSRLMMRVAGAAVPPKPDAPRLTGAVRNGRVELAWTAPPQPLAGYRIEYRIGDGAWNELERWFDADDDQITVTWQLRERVAYQFRIRAFNDAGAGDYSAPVVVNLPKRRSVR